MAMILRNRVPKEHRIITTAAHTETAQLARCHNHLATHYFRLPLELRDNIYEHIWASSEPFAFRYRRLWIVVCHKHHVLHHHGESFGLPHWLLTSQGILHEGLAALHRTQALMPVSERTRCLRLYPRSTGAKRNSLLFNESIRYIRSANTLALVSTWEHEPELYWRHQCEDKLFAIYLKHLRITPQEMRFKADVHSIDLRWEGIARRSMIQMHLGVLHLQCRTVMFDLAFPGVWVGNDGQTTPHVFLSALQATEDCANTLVGPDGGAWKVLQGNAGRKLDNAGGYIVLRLQRRVDGNLHRVHEASRGQKRKLASLEEV